VTGAGIMTSWMRSGWLAEHGMLRPSFVPPEPVRQLRDLTRLRTSLTGDRARFRNRVEKAAVELQLARHVQGKAVIDL
jgi:hypothetical protein